MGRAVLKILIKYSTVKHFVPRSTILYLEVAFVPYARRGPNKVSSAHGGTRNYQRVMAKRGPQVALRNMLACIPLCHSVGER